MRSIAAILLLSLFFAGALGRARVRPLWHDEVFTWHIARQPDGAAIWSALATGVDLNPPLYHLLVHQASRLTASDRLAVRLPAVAGFTAMLAGLGLFVARRCGVAAGAIAASVVALSGVGPYAYEGRPYGLVLGCAALALLAWQGATAATGWRRPLWLLTLTTSLAAALAAHYYAALILVPLAVGEAFRTSQRRRVDMTVVTAVTLPLAVFAALRPLIDVAREWMTGFWSPPSPGDAARAYAVLLAPLGTPLMVSLGLVAVVAALTRAGWLPPAHTPRGRPGMPGHELVALAVFAVLPAIGLLVAWTVTGAWHERYALPAILGLAGLAAVGVHASGTLALRTAAAVLVTALAAQAGLRAGDWFDMPRLPIAVALADRADGGSVLPVLASDGLTFVELAHAASPALAMRLSYGLKPPSIIAQTGTDTENRALQQLARLAPLRLERFEQFVDRHRQFFVIGRDSWVTEALVAADVPLRLVAAEGDLRLFVVRE